MNTMLPKKFPTPKTYTPITVISIHWNQETFPLKSRTALDLGAVKRTSCSALRS